MIFVVEPAVGGWCAHLVCGTLSADVFVQHGFAVSISVCLGLPVGFQYSLQQEGVSSSDLILA